MKTKIKKLDNCQIEATVSFEAKEWQDARDEAFKKLAKKVEVKGFRKGHVPENIVKKHINGAEVMHEAIDALLPNAYTKVLDDEKIEPFARPSVNVTKMSDTECEVVIIITTRPEVELGKYKGHKIGHNEIKVSDKDLKAEIAKKLQDNAELVVKTGKAVNGDTVNIDFEGFVDGVAFDGGKAENYSLELGSNSFVPGFEEQLVGLKAEDKADIKVTFPKEYPAGNLAGKETTFKIIVHEVKEKKVPELNDEAVADLAIKDVKTVEEFKAHVKAELTQKLTNEENNRYFTELVNKIADDAKIAIPDVIIEDEVEAMLNNLKQQIEKNGLDINQYLELTNQKLEDVTAKMKEEATRNVKNFFTLEKIAEVEEITVDDAVLELEVAKMAEQYKMEIDKVKEIVFKDKARFAENIKRDHINQFVLKNND